MMTPRRTALRFVTENNMNNNATPIPCLDHVLLSCLSGKVDHIRGFRLLDCRTLFLNTAKNDIAIVCNSNLINAHDKQQSCIRFTVSNYLTLWLTAAVKWF